MNEKLALNDDILMKIEKPARYIGAIVENHLWCIKAVMKQNRALIRAAKLDTDDVYQQLALRLIRAVMSYDPEKGDLEQHIFAQLRMELQKTAHSSVISLDAYRMRDAA